MDDIILRNKGSLFFKFYVKCIESLFLKFSGSLKVLLIGSVGNDKYYVLENEYFKVNFKNGNI